MTETIRPSEEDLQAFIDGELDAELARQMHAYRADKARLSQIYGPLIDRPLPEAWLATIANRNVVALPVRSTRRRFIGMGLAASLALIAGGTVMFRQFSMRSGEAAKRCWPRPFPRMRKREPCRPGWLPTARFRTLWASP